jgi:nicotinate-nucleotide pyrophosphorylase (carboxylating)
MIPPFDIDAFLLQALREDLGDGDHTSLSTIPLAAKGTARLLVKQEGVLAGVDIAIRVFTLFDPTLTIEKFISDGTTIRPGEIVFEVHGPSRSIVSAERLSLNILQRMSGIATKTHRIQALIANTGCRLLDTRKTTPGFRYFEKLAVQIGGGTNHRFGLYDMIMVKDNHVDFAGGVTKALEKVDAYLLELGKPLKVEVEARNLQEVEEALATGIPFRIMLDNFSPERLREAVAFIHGRVETEASGGITEANIVEYAETGVDYISVGALTHQIQSLDLSLKAVQ